MPNLEVLLNKCFDERIPISETLEEFREWVEKSDLPRHKFEWVYRELDSYKDKRGLPGYRKVKGWKTSFHRRRLFGQSDTTHTRKKKVVPVLMPIDKIETLIETLAKEDMDATIKPDKTEKSRCYQEVSLAELGKIPQAVRHKFASWISNYLRQEPSQNLPQKMPESYDELPPPKTKQGRSKTFWAVLGGVLLLLLGIAGDIAGVWGTWGKAIMRFLGFGD